MRFLFVGFPITLFSTLMIQMCSAVELTLPTKYYDDYVTFKERLDTAFLCHGGFGLYCYVYFVCWSACWSSFHTIMHLYYLKL